MAAPVIDGCSGSQFAHDFVEELLRIIVEPLLSRGRFRIPDEVSARQIGEIPERADKVGIERHKLPGLNASISGFLEPRIGSGARRQQPALHVLAAVRERIASKGALRS